MTRLWLTLATGILAASPVAADDVKVPRVQIGGSVSGILPIAAEDGFAVVVGAGPKLTVDVWKGIRVELTAEVVGPTESSGTYAFYLTEVKVPIRTRDGGARTLFVTAGAAGAASYQRFDETRRTRPDGSTIVNPGFQRFLASAPSNLTIGISQDHVLNRKVAASWALHTFIGDIGGLAVRGSVGLSFGIGGYR